MKNRNWFWGIFFLLSALFVIGIQLNSFVEIGFISILATIFLISIMIDSIIRCNFFGIFVPIAFLYDIYSKPLNLVDISIWLLLLSAVLASIGFSIIFKKHPKDWAYHGNYVYKHSKGNDQVNQFGSVTENGQVNQFNTTTENMDDNNPYAKVSFGSASKYLHGNAIKSGQFIVSFGSMEVYFDQAQLDPEGADIFLDCSFGAIQLYVPRNWRVRDNIHATLGGVDNEAKFARTDDNSPILNLNGNVSFSGVEIHYI